MRTHYNKQTTIPFSGRTGTLFFRAMSTWTWAQNDFFAGLD